jgi:hypothetical protein
MASINASTAGVGGVITTSDNTGNLNIQSGGSTKIAVTSAGVAVTGLSKGSLPTGSVLQVVNATTSTQVSVASTTRTDTGLTATITPTSATNKILVVTSCRIYASPSSVGNASSDVRLLREATTLQTLARYGFSEVTNTGSGDQFVTSYLDSPATTSATTYKITFNRAGGNGTVYAQLDSDLSTITLMEIAA